MHDEEKGLKRAKESHCFSLAWEANLQLASKCLMRVMGQAKSAKEEREREGKENAKGLGVGGGGSVVFVIKCHHRLPQGVCLFLWFRSGGAKVFRSYAWALLLLG